MVTIKCDGKTLEDCFECDRAFSSDSLDWSTFYQEKVSKINCSIGGNRVFNEDGELIDNFGI